MVMDTVTISGIEYEAPSAVVKFIFDLDDENALLKGSAIAADMRIVKQGKRIAELEAEVEQLRSFVHEQPCECFDEYGKKKLQICDRCKLLGKEE